MFRVFFVFFFVFFFSKTATSVARKGDSTGPPGQIDPIIATNRNLRSVEHQYCWSGATEEPYRPGYVGSMGFCAAPQQFRIAAPTPQPVRAELHRTVQ